MSIAEGTRKEDAWYWSPEWQAWEVEADEDRQVGRYEVYESMDDFIASLDEGVEHDKEGNKA